MLYVGNVKLPHSEAAAASQLWTDHGRSSDPHSIHISRFRYDMRTLAIDTALSPGHVE